MNIYRNLSGHSNVQSYQITTTSVIVMFKVATRLYSYSHASAGAYHVEELKKLAVSGRGLNSYIMKHVRNNYDRQIA